MKKVTPRQLAMKNLALGYGNQTIVPNLSLDIPTGEITAHADSAPAREQEGDDQTSADQD